VESATLAVFLPSLETRKNSTSNPVRKKKSSSFGKILERGMWKLEDGLLHWLSSKAKEEGLSNIICPSKIRNTNTGFY
jgi:hypothetical protein